MTTIINASPSSPWPAFWIASSAVFLVSLDSTMLFAAFDALRHSFYGSSATALLTPASMSIELAAFPAERRAVVISLWGAVGGLAALVGPSLGSWVAAHAGWPWAFYLNVPPGLWAVWRSAARVDEAVKPVQRRCLDGVGLLLLLMVAVVPSRSPSWKAVRPHGIWAGSRRWLAVVVWQASRSCGGRASIPPRWSTFRCSTTPRTATSTPRRSPSVRLYR